MNGLSSGKGKEKNPVSRLGFACTAKQVQFHSNSLAGKSYMIFVIFLILSPFVIFSLMF
jgi:hypothetical protein